MDDFDISAAIADFAEAVRKGRIGYIIAEDPMVYREDYKPANIDTSVPVIWLHTMFQDNGQLLDDKHGGEEQFMSFATEANQLIENKAFHLPYPKCMFAYLVKGRTERTGGYSGSVAIHVIYCEQDPTTLVVNFTQFLKVVVKPVFTHITYRDNWAITPIRARFGPGGVQYGEFPDVRRPRPTAEYFFGSTVLAAQIVGVATMLLNEPHAVTRETVQPGPVAMAANVGRVRGKLKPLGEVIKIDLDLRPAAPEPTGRHIASTAKRPHDRRGHWVTSKKGKKFWRRNMAIKGGRAQGAIYNVE